MTVELSIPVGMLCCMTEEALKFHGFRNVAVGGGTAEFSKEVPSIKSAYRTARKVFGNSSTDVDVYITEA